MATFSVSINARDSKEGISDIKYVRKIQAKSMTEALGKVIGEIELAVPKCEILDTESRRVTD